MEPNESIELFKKIRQGDQNAQTEVFDRYVLRLLGLVRANLSKNFSRRLDPEDVVQSAYRSFYRGVENDRFALENSGDLWRLLAAITIHKLQHQIERNRAGKRSVDREQNVHLVKQDSLFELCGVAIEQAPTAEDEVALSEVVKLLTEGFSQQQMSMFELRLAGWSLEQIAEQVGCSERTVRRFFNGKVKPVLQEKLRDS